MSDTMVLALTAVLALAVLGWTPWTIWHIARRTPTRQRATADVLLCVAGAVLLGVILPAVLKGALDPFPIWLIYAALTVTAVTVLGWRYAALPRPTKEGSSGLVAASCVLAVVVTLAGFAVT